MRSYGATERVFELINRTPEFAGKKHNGEHISLKGEIEFENVSFSYPGRTEQAALSAFNLKIAPGEKVALVGPSGAGKSTVASLLLGFYQPSSGGIKFDGYDSSNLSLEDIRQSIVIVEQEPTLFAGTIAQNIGFAINEADASLNNIESAAKQAFAHGFISEFPKGYQTIVGE
jgi:ATP-binding cassette subfamily B protein